MRQTLRTIFLTILFFGPSFAFAQESGTGSTASGATLEDAPYVLTEELRERAKGFALKMQSSASERRFFREKQEERRMTRMQHQVNCRAEIRKANRDTLFPTVQRCYRAQLTQDLELLRKHRSALEEFIGASEERKTAALMKTDALIEAILAVIDGIDTGVFVTSAELLEAKANVATLYRTPYWTTLLQLRADHLRTWIAYYLIQISALPEHPSLTQTADCLEPLNVLLLRILDTNNYEVAVTDFRQAHSALKMCVEWLAPPPPPVVEEEVTPRAEEEQEPKEDTSELPRRVQRRMR